MPRLPGRRGLAVGACILVLGIAVRVAADDDCARARAGGLLALYDFDESTGTVVRDRSGAGEPIDLEIGDLRAVRRTPGALEVSGRTKIRSKRRPKRLIEAIRRSGEVTIEAWIRCANGEQKGPARIVTLSRSSTERNFTLGQNGPRFDVRLRTTETSSNGVPSLASSRVASITDWTHVVYSRDRRGRALLYLDGVVSGEAAVGGATVDWSGKCRLALGDEVDGGRPWHGSFRRVALYDRALGAAEVLDHFRGGPDAPLVEPEQERAPAPERRFEEEIAPLIARHCLECHDTATKKGGLDLSRRSAALAGGDSGAAIVPGRPETSLLWETIESDEMPRRRPPLSESEKRAVRDWIAAGATWSLETLTLFAAAEESVRRESWLRRLTVEEYIRTVRGAVGVDIAAEARAVLPPDVRADGFSNTAYNLTVDLGLVDAYARLAETIVERVDVLAFAARFSKSRLLTDDSMRGLIANMGRWLLRGSLADEEITALRGISTTVAASGGDFEEAVRYIIQAMLQSPRFVYRIEKQRGDAAASPVYDYELASRLSYTIWGAPPDEELMNAVEEGRLYHCDDVQAQVERMLADPRAVEQSLRFVHEWLDLDRLDHLRPDPRRFPSWDARLAADMREETLAFFRQIIWTEARPLSHLLNAQVTWATPRLAAHYRLPGAADPAASSGAADPAASSGAGNTELVRYDLSSVPGRGGLLTHGSVLTVGGDDASMVSRGLFILEDLLHGRVQDPPPCVDTTPVPTRAGLTQRGIAEERIADPTCGGCHGKFEPLAFGLERFDGVGAWHRRDEHGNDLRDDGALLVPGAERAVPYASSAELMELLAASDRVRQTLTRKVIQFAVGRPLTAADEPIVQKIDAAAEEGGGTWTSVMSAVVMSELVQFTRLEPTS